MMQSHIVSPALSVLHDRVLVPGSHQKRVTVQVQNECEHALEGLQKVLQVLDAQERRLSHMRLPALCERVAQLNRRHACITAKRPPTVILLFERCAVGEYHTGSMEVILCDFH